MGRRLLLVRHAETRKQRDVHPGEWELTDAGREAARALACTIALREGTGVFSSPERKALQTAEPLGARATVLADLREHSVRETRWLEPAELDRLLRAYFAEGATRVFGDESRHEAVSRFRAALDRALATTSGDVVVVSHGRVIASYLAHLLDTTGYELWRMLTMPAVITIANPDSAGRIVEIRCFHAEDG